MPIRVWMNCWLAVRDLLDGGDTDAALDMARWLATNKPKGATLNAMVLNCVRALAPIVIAELKSELDRSN